MPCTKAKVTRAHIDERIEITLKNVAVNKIRLTNCTGFVFSSLFLLKLDACLNARDMESKRKMDNEGTGAERDKKKIFEYENRSTYERQESNLAPFVSTDADKS